ncbi:FecR family protein, partial [Chitinophaga sp.]|uniref:FecR family protein n=1 Tax=Chitinophaga sp. TaxID=1869181 RepID=UPI002F91EA3A
MSDFQDYHSEDFLQEPSFCRYCTGTDASAVAFWESWINTHPEKQAVVKQARELYYILNGNITARTFAQQRQQFETAFRQHLQETPVRRISPVWKILARAAVIALLINVAGFAVYQYKKQNRLRNYSSLAGERKSFQLPDGTSVMLNANSHITIAQHFNKEAREITLVGEAFFDVA